ncbi:hypothetical protein DINM_022024 [Dirofilaria immitis]|nr:hypothetical protein [Dirofilaria immitis]
MFATRFAVYGRICRDDVDKNKHSSVSFFWTGAKLFYLDSNLYRGYQRFENYAKRHHSCKEVMGVLSKFLVDILGLKISKGTCYEMMHTWNPDCYGAIIDSLQDGWKMLGFFTVPTLGLMNGMISALIAILIENRKRRPLLALYLTNLASETAYHQLVNHGYLKYIPNGVRVLHIPSLNVVHERVHGVLRDVCCGMAAVKFQLPRQTASLRMKWKLLLTIWAKSIRDVNSLMWNPIFHVIPSCALHLVKDVFFNNFCQALIWSVGMVILKIGKETVRQPITSMRRILRLRTIRLPLFYGFLALLFQRGFGSIKQDLGAVTNPKDTVPRYDNWHRLTIALLYKKLFGDHGFIHFISMDFSPKSVYLVSRCGYGWCTNEVSPLSFCGVVAALSLFFYPNISIAMYVFWKFVEVSGLLFSYYKNLVIPYGDIILYALSTGYVAWNAVIEPQTLREGYWKFLVGLTGNKIQLLNRRLFDSFGYNSSKKFPNFMPKLDSRFTSLNEIWSVIHHD